MKEIQSLEIIEHAGRWGEFDAYAASYVMTIHPPVENWTKAAIADPPMAWILLGTSQPVTPWAVAHYYYTPSVDFDINGVQVLGLCFGVGSAVAGFIDTGGVSSIMAG